MFVTVVIVKVILLFTLINADNYYDYSEPPTESVSHRYTWEGCHVVMPKETRKLLIKTGKYDPRKSIAIKCQNCCDKTICAFPRYNRDTPLTLGIISNKKPNHCNAKFEPWPCWDEQEEGECKALQSVVDMQTVGDYICVLDTGTVDSMHHAKQTCPPKIVCYDCKTGVRKKTINLARFVTEHSNLQQMVWDCNHKGECHIHVSDAGNNCIITYDTIKNRGYRLVLPKAVSHGCKKREVMFLHLSHREEENILFFTYLAGSRMYSITSEQIKKGKGGKVTDVGLKHAKLVIIGSNGGSDMFVREEGERAVYKWDTRTCFKRSNFKLVYKGDCCLYATHVFPDLKHGKMNLLESDFPGFHENKIGCGCEQQISILNGLSI